ncbi:MAG: phosphocarrier protein HPr [Candidatus Cloacimonadota bacterium]|nr:MAG: phosphocarrier protein HPr [Candidatus Cloacimonadota bacterium]
MIRKKVVIQNKLGLHARPSSLLIKLAQNFRSEFKIVKDDMEVNGKSIMGVMMLGAPCGTELELIADGVDEEYMIEEIVNLFESKFDEE